MDPLDPPARRPARRALVAWALVLGFVLGSVGTGAVLLATPLVHHLPVSCTLAGAWGGVFVRFTQEDAADATEASLRVRDDGQVISTSMPLKDSVWDGESATSIVVSPSTGSMESLTAVELTFHGPGGERTLTAAQVGEPIVHSPNGRFCEPHVLRSTFAVEGDVLVRSDT